VYAFFLALREPHVVTIDPLPSSTSPTRDAVPNHHRNSSSSAQFASAISSVSTNPPPSGRSHITGASTIPATRPRSELEGENRIDALPQLPEIRSCAPTPPCRRNRFDALSSNSHSLDIANERARKRQRLETTSSNPEIASSSRLGTSAVQHDPLPENTFSMRLPEREYDTNPTSPDFRPRASSSSLSPSPKTNGHVANGCGSPINGSSKRSRGRVAKVELPGATIYDDSYIDREEYIRLVIQSLRDIGYMCVFDYVLLI
jgi:hypothetical protein